MPFSSLEELRAAATSLLRGDDEAAATVAADSDSDGASDPLAAAGVVPDEPETRGSDAASAPQP